MGQLAAGEAHTISGVWLALDGKNTRQVEEMRKQTVEWIGKVRTGSIDRRDETLNLSIMRKLESPFVVLILSETQCEYIMASALVGGLSRARICKNMPHTVLYGDLDHQGVGLHILYTTIGISQV